MGLPTNSAAENALATIGTICWTLQVVPQIWKSWREKSTDGLSPWLVFFWGISGAPLGVYAIVQDLNIPLIIQPHAFATLSIFSWAQCQYYGQHRPFRTCAAMFVTTLALCGGFEAGMIFAVRPSFRAGNEAGVEFFGILSSVMISCALIPQFIEIWRRREVVGLSVLFMLVDWSGGIFSLLSLVFKEKFDIIASVTYSAVVVLDGAILLLAAILNPRAKRRRALEAQSDGIAGADMSPCSTISPNERIQPENEEKIGEVSQVEKV
ncbi:PQ loop repeat-domain-containing protein [Irpex rosettiformis]|uniref:PQ loop repeat-domain-containing protein n=1 Tax=Irpex rosettiformis TaxID=378272 RepID=A0ACB8TPS3_9APHY|nr:PQ loop repeat-domain-containing protein [Irpex rosettiformis]